MPIDPYTVGVLALLVLALPFVFWSQYQLWKVLNDPEHPDHEMAKEAIKEQHRNAELDELRDGLL